MEQAIRTALLLRSTLYKEIDASLLSSLTAVAEQHALGAKGLAAAFDKFMTVTRQDSTGITANDVQAFAAGYAKTTVAKATPGNFFNRGSWEDADVDAVQESAILPPSQRITPYMNKAAARPTSSAKHQVTPASSAKFRERAQSGAVQAVLNARIQQPDFAEAMETDATPQRSAMKVLGKPVEAQARYMVNRIEDKVAYLEGRITALERDVEASCGEGAPQPVATAVQQEAYFVGRVCCDTEDGRLNPQSALLEGSIKLSQGNRVRLDLSNCPQYRLFPGQVVAVRGTNPTGLCVAALEVHHGLPLPMQRTSLQELVSFTEATSSQGQSYVVAAGPYTTSEDLAYEPLTALLEYCAAHRADMLLLMGPFVDVEHPMVCSGALDETFEDIYRSQVAGRLTEFVESQGGRTRVVLLPSVRDAHHDPVFPQTPLGEVAGATTLANPATFSCNEVVLGCSSADWLMACTKEEVSKAAGQVDRLPALASHTISQRSFFPMFPAPLGTPLDASKAQGLEMPCTPDILIVPSELAPFAKLLPVPSPKLPASGGGMEVAEGGEDTVVCVNPGKLTKGATGGTFAHVYVGPHLLAKEVAEGKPAPTNGAVLHEVANRCRVEIKKI